MIARLSCVLMLLCLRPAAAASRTFAIDSNASNVRAHVGKTGIGSFAGHEHEVVARSMQGEVVADFEDLSRSSVDVTVSARALTVSEVEVLDYIRYEPFDLRIALPDEQISARQAGTPPAGR